MSEEDLIEAAKRIKAYFESQRGLNLHHSLTSAVSRSSLDHLTQETLARITKSVVDQTNELALAGVIKVQPDFSLDSPVAIYPGSRLDEFADRAFDYEQGKENPFLFYLSRTQGLYRIFRGKDEIYPVHRADKRFEILSNLKTSFVKTDDLAKMVNTTPQKLRAQIAGIKKQINNHFDGVSGVDFIVGDQKFGYRFGDKIKLLKR